MESFELIREAFDVVVHLDAHLNAIVDRFGAVTYLILFLTVFAETGLVITPFFPGDSLLFAVGALAASGGHLRIELLIPLLFSAAVLGDFSNYHIGYYLGPRMFRKTSARFFKVEQLERTHRFFRQYGSTSIVMARFMPVLRTFIPFVAGIGRMGYGRFVTYNLVGAALWIMVFLVGGYLFGNLEFIQENFYIVIMAIAMISVIPGAIHLLRIRSQNRPPAIS